MIRSVLVLCTLLVFHAGVALASGAERFTGYVNLGGGETYVSYKAAAAGQPTLVLLNGLTYSLGDWDSFVAAFEKAQPRAGVLRFDMIGMGRTLLKGTLPVSYEISYADQAELTARVMSHFGVRKAFVAGLSYGGAIAVAFGHAHPEMVEQLILMAPFTEPLENMDRMIRNEITATRATFPYNHASDDELYDYFLRQFIYSTYPPLEPGVLENPYKLEAIFRMVQGVRKYDPARDTRAFPAGFVHLMVADQDQYIQKDVHDRFWRQVPESVRASRVDISVTEHKIPEAIPAYAAAWIAEILGRRAELNRGLSFEGSASTFSARSGNVTIRLPRAGR